MAPLGLLAGVSILLAMIAWRARAFFAALERVGGTPGAAPGQDPLVSVVVPVRNEAANVERCLRSVFGQRHQALEVVVVDDNSTDATPAILARLAAAEPRLTILAGAPLPPGWTGKNFALAQAAPHLQGEWVLFLDADTWLEPDAIGAAVAHAEERGLGLLSLVPRQRLSSFWERVIQPVVLLVIALALPLEAMADPRRPQVAYANGQFLLVRRAAYEKAGGHAAQQAAIVEDSALARAVKMAGYAVQLADGRALVHIRMYRDLGQLWEGWSKNSFESLGRRVHNVLLLIMAVSVVTLVPPVVALVALGRVVAPGGIDSAAALVSGVAGLQTAFILCLVWRCNREADVPGRYTLAVPLGAAMFNALMCYSAYRVISGRGVSWKGRVYSP
ncbi:MAG TPA: glycosyltransferase family 2 protein [Chloroflexota bacterium]|jgi:chlorobactene glucosyltransferase